jgi:hypothetical protein
MKRFAALVVLVMLTTLGLAAFTETYARPDGASFSHSELWGMPLLAVRGSGEVDLTPALISLGLPGLGVLSVGVGGLGLVSIGALGVGILFGVGQLGTGLISIGQMSFGGLVGIGQLSLGWASLGQLALGVRARGQGYKWRGGDVFFGSLHRELEELLRFDPIENRF